ncbi:FUSC family protein [Sphingomonas sp. CGMCC 1.13654]|uniref:FUSC family protein n=1 Tax=Sphingomonas chungangi TaxID=2683589 RepID=A0A838L9A4_9SPHN|nr:FUSC family protein [Sphingomonas chungangi]MBA2935362.1 FUSC family protein [Sphingomonas chungangi]MVW56868.1 FUSC family protein [Sphingomonas chungangi]
MDRIDARTIDETEVVASVLLAILFAHLLHAANVSWAAFSGYMVMRGHAAETVVRGVLRIAGTVTGGLLALVATPWLLPFWPAQAIALAFVCTICLYGAITAKRAYAWLFFGLTFVMVVLDKVEHPARPLLGFVETRVLEVVAGTVACVIVSLASTLTLRRRWPATRAKPLEGGWHPPALRHAAQGAVALVLLSGLSRFLELPALAQSAITIMAVMLVPITSLGATGFGLVNRRILYRFVGCGAGAALAALFLFVAQGSPPILIVGTILGVAIGRHIENSGRSIAYVGTQFVLAILIILVPDSYAQANLTPAWERLAGIFIGMAVLEPVLLIWHLADPKRPKKAEPEAGTLGDL